ncbi:MAG: hypothetical protein ACK531_04885 [Cyanobacteriota bacterium]|jgi:hypothetical protein
MAPAQRRGQSEFMKPASYRVRPTDLREQSVPDDVLGPRFHSLADADRYARELVLSLHRAVIVEKLAPGGCWLQLSSLS